jgi:ubiquinone/menaquinone biosynthesis C-methylase UbiE
MSKLSLWLKVLWIALTSRSNQEFYDRVSPIYDQVFTEHKLHAENIADKLSSSYAGRETSTHVIDLGCGTGMLCRILADRGFDVTGVDISYKSLQRLQQNDSRISILQADSALLPIADHSFDVVVSLGAWRHFPDAKRVLEEISRVLTKDGILIIGYFPPALGGAIRHGKGVFSRLQTSIYQFLTGKLGYVDQPSLLLESETVKIAGGFFNKTNTVVSGELWNLIVASNPKEQGVPNITP